MRSSTCDASAMSVETRATTAGYRLAKRDPRWAACVVVAETR